MPMCESPRIFWDASMCGKGGAGQRREEIGELDEEHGGYVEERGGLGIIELEVVFASVSSHANQ